MVAQTKNLTLTKLVGVFNSLKGMWRSSLSAPEQALLLSQALWLRGAKVEAISMPFEGQWQYGNVNGTSGIVIYPSNRALLREALGYPAEKDASEL